MNIDMDTVNNFVWKIILRWKCCYNS